MRSHLCGHAFAEGERVRLCGHLKSRRAIGGVTFGVLRDWSGEVQFVQSRDAAPAEEYETLSRAPVESVVRVEGVVRGRVDGASRGAVEVRADGEAEGRVEVLNAAEGVPMHVGDEGNNEETRLRHRHLDLRRPVMQRRLRLRAQVAAAVREHLGARRGFVEVETPTLFRTTPEGAREFLVPTRRAGHFYALPQSPQQYKQVLMASGVDRYYQLARCYRDEGARGDRQPEFTQVDIEAAYVTRDDMMREVEGLVAAVLDPRTYDDGAGPALPLPPAAPAALPRPPRVPFAEAVARYGSDKPDARGGMEIREGAFCAPGLSTALSRRRLDEEAAAAPPGVGLARVGAGGALRAPRRLLDALGGGAASLAARLGAAEGDLLAVAAPGSGAGPEALGALRLRLAELRRKAGLVVGGDDGCLHLMWVTDFPLFERDPDRGDALSSTHHPFTAPLEEDEALLRDALDDLGPAPRGVPADHPVFAVRAQHYDLVANGVELGGGSVRIHSEATQRAVIRALGADEASFEHLFEVLRHGCPPHAGLALGFDRLVAMLCGVPSLRDVIAFPKTAQGNDLMARAPSHVSNAELERAGHLFRATG